MTPLRVLLADDHTMLREGLRRSLAGHGIEIVGEANDGKAALDQAASLKPDVILMDVTMPILNGIDATRQIRRTVPGCAVVMLSMHGETEMRSQAAKAGAADYLVKDCSTDDIVAAIYKAAGMPPPETDSKVLTHREAEILQMIADGKGTSEAAAALFISLKTVKNHLASAYAKLDAADRTQAIVKAAKLGIINLDV